MFYLIIIYPKSVLDNKWLKRQKQQNYHKILICQDGADNITVIAILHQRVTRYSFVQILNVLYADLLASQFLFLFYILSL